MKTYRHLFFDLDNTLTRSRTKITPAMKDVLMSHISSDRDIVVVSGAACSQIQFQMDSTPCHLLGQNGNHCIDIERGELWQDLLSDEHKQEIYAHIRQMHRGWQVPDEHDLIDDRGAQLCYSIYGHHAPVHIKETFDPDHAIRKRLLQEYPFVSEHLEVKISGTTTLDYFRKGKTKGHNVARFINSVGWNKDDAVYFGDMLVPGGNDESVIGVIDTVLVADPLDTLQKLQAML